MPNTKRTRIGVLLALSVAIGVFGAPARGRAADPTGTWAASGTSKAKVCFGRTCLRHYVQEFAGRVMLKRDRTYRIPGGACTPTGEPLPDEVGTWRLRRGGRTALTMTNAPEVEDALRACLGLDVLVLDPARGWLSAGACKAAGAGRERLCGLRALRGRARAGGRIARLRAANRFVATRDFTGPLCGDGHADPGEDCDDGNLDDADACTSVCATVCRSEPVTDTWHAIRSRVFARHSCTAAACHGDARSGGLDLHPDRAYASLVGVAASGAPGTLRVEPGAPEASLLWRKLAKATIGGLEDVPGAAMPSGAPALTADELDAVRLWIGAGAPATGLVPETDRLLAGCPGSGPAEPAPPPPPAAAEGVQFYAPPWTIPPHGEDEVCFATWYDFTAQIPVEHQVPCPPMWGGPGRRCFFYDRTTLTQSPNSHHSIIHVYAGASDVADGGFGAFTCHGGPRDGTRCDPKVGEPAPDGADCGPGGGCAGATVSSVACVGYGPPDFAPELSGIGGSQEAESALAYPPGVFSLLPTRGVVVWNSHAFNTTGQPTTNRQWFNLYFAGADDRRYPAQGIFDLKDIFVQQVPPFERREYCSTTTVPRGARLFSLGSHTHRRGALFRIWGPGVKPCRPQPLPGLGPDCGPEAGTPLALTTDYTQPIDHRFEPPLEMTGADDASRTFKYCAVYDNGAFAPDDVRRASRTPPRGASCDPSERVCLHGPKRGVPCDGVDRRCDSRKGAGDGLCDACPLRGGVTTEDEMFILLGLYYCPEGSSCWVPVP